jgi:hypothetical protein
MRRDVVAMLYWTLRWHEGRRVSCKVLCDVLWGEFALQPEDPAGSLRELMGYVRKRYGNTWTIEECGRAFRITPHVRLPGTKNKPGMAADKKKAAFPKRGLGGRSMMVTRARGQRRTNKSAGEDAGRLG